MGVVRPLILSFRRDGLKDLDPSNVDEVHKMWHAFSKAKHSIDGGDRLEYLSWRLYSREMLRMHAEPPKICLDSPPPPMDKANIEELEDSELTSSSEDDWEATDASHLSGEPQKASHHAQQSAAPLDACSTDYTHNSSNSTELSGLSKSFSRGNSERSRTRLKEPFSSVELEHIFSDVQENTVPIKPRHSGEKTHSAQIFDLKSRSDRILTPQNSEGSATSQFSYNYRTGMPLRNQDSAKLDSASTVRGFSPLSVSISKQPSSYEIANDETADRNFGHCASSIEDSFTNFNYKEFETKPLASKKIFYLGSQDSDFESSTSGSVEPAMAHRILPNPNVSENNSDWDDVDDTDDDNDTAEEECRRREMFKERPVPTKPLLKRSLLSSMFVSSMKTANHQRGPEPNLPASADLASAANAADDKDHSAMPAEILLEAPLAPHLPFKTVQDADSAAQSRTNHLGLSPPKKIPNKATTAHSGSMSGHFTPLLQDQNNAHRTHIIARPEMYRASSTFAQQSCKNSGEKSPEEWESNHENIYDPLNYHSRGW